MKKGAKFGCSTACHFGFFFFKYSHNIATIFIKTNSETFNSLKSDRLFEDSCETYKNI